MGLAMKGEWGDANEKEHVDVPTGNILTESCF